MNLFPLLFAAFLSLGTVQDNQDTTGKKTEGVTTAMTAEIKVCVGIADNLPVGEGNTFPSNIGKLYVWTRIAGGPGETTIKHVYFREGTEMTTVDIQLHETPWNTWSMMVVKPTSVGDWEVRVISQAGSTLGVAEFSIVPSDDMKLTPDSTIPPDTIPPDTSK